MLYMTQAQIAKAAYDHMKNGGLIANHGLSDKQIWRIGYIYAGVVAYDHGQVTRQQFNDIHFEGMPEAHERFNNEREEWLASLSVA
jgi:hypothetical protein